MNDLVNARISGNSLGMKGSGVSRHHATTICTKRGVIIRGENSTIGILINGQHIPMTILKPGEQKQIGTSELVFFIKCKS